jgi:hypothetical protein
MSLEQYNSLMERLTRLETIVGDAPDEGIRSELKGIREDLNSIRKQMLMMMGAGVVLYWLLSKIPAASISKVFGVIGIPSL